MLRVAWPVIIAATLRRRQMDSDSNSFDLLLKLYLMNDKQVFSLKALSESI